MEHTDAVPRPDGERVAGAGPSATHCDPPAGVRCVSDARAALAMLSNVDQTAVVLVVLMGATVFPWALMGSWSTRTAVMVLVLPLGLLCFARLLVARDRAAWWAGSFVGAAALSALMARSPSFAFLGSAGPHSSVLLYAGAAAAWAIGRCLSGPGRSTVRAVAYTVAGANVLVGAWQVVHGVDAGVFAATGGRATGMFENSIAYGLVLAGAAAGCLAAGLRPAASSWSLVGSTVFAFGGALSGSRIATLVICLGGLLTFGFDRGRRGAAAVASVAVGLGAATWLGLSTTSASTVERALQRGGDGRLNVWKYGWNAALNRPVLGWGPGHHAYAIRREFSFDFTRDHAWADSFSAWSDSHNVVVMLLVTTGIVGLCTALGWILTSLRSMQDVVFAVWFLAIAAGWAVEPATVHTLPLALLLLGASGPVARAQRRSRRAETTHLAAIGVGTAAASLYFVPLVIVQHAIDDHDGLRAASAAAWAWRDPLVADRVAERLAIDAQLAAAREPGGGAAERSASLEWSERVPAWAPMSSWAWNSLAFRQIALDEPGVADSLDRVFALDRWNSLGWQLQLRWAVESGDDELAAQSREVVCDLELPACDEASG